MTSDSAVIVASAAAFATGILAGASLDQTIKQLPARHRMGERAFLAYVRSADLGNGTAWYAILGVGAALLTIAAAAVVLFGRPVGAARLPAVLSACLALAHSFTTTRAAPIYLGLRAGEPSDQALHAAFGRFARWQAARAGLQAVNFLVLIWMLVS